MIPLHIITKRSLLHSSMYFKLTLFSSSKVVIPCMKQCQNTIRKKAPCKVMDNFQEGVIAVDNFFKMRSGNKSLRLARTLSQ